VSDSTKCMPDDGAVQRIASHDPANLYTSGARTKAMAVEILRLRAELARANDANKVLRDDAQQTHRLIAAKETAIQEADRLRAELAKAKRCLERHGFVDNGGQEWKPPLGPTPHRFAGAAALATSYGESQEAKDEPPADVLGEAYREAMEEAITNGDVPASIYVAVAELAQVVERIARQQEAK